MNTRSRCRRVIATSLAVFLLGLMAGGCFFEDSIISVVTFSDEGDIDISFSKSATPGLCQDEGAFRFSCDFFGFVNSSFELLTAEELLFLLFLIDPLVVQLPDDAHDFAGSFNTGSGGDDLVITPGLSTVPVDEDRSLVAEPGTQLVTIELPPGAPTSGEFDFNFNFMVPSGTTEIIAKPLFTGRIELTDGRVFYAPTYPCVSDMAQVPELVIAIPPPGDMVEIPAPSQGLACDGEVYRYGEGAPVPAAGPAALVGLVLLILLSGAGWIATRG